MPQVQSAISQTLKNSTTATLTFPQKIGVGNAIVGMVCYDYTFSAATSSITDDQSNTYTQGTADIVQYNIGNPNFWQLRAVPFYLGNITNGPQTLTVSLSPSATFTKILASEYTGAIRLANPIDVFGFQVGDMVNPGTAVDWASFSTQYNNEDIWWGVFSRDGGVITVSSTFTGITPGFNVRASDSTDTSALIFDQTVLAKNVSANAYVSVSVPTDYVVGNVNLRPALAGGSSLVNLRGKLTTPKVTISPPSKSLFTLQGQCALVQTGTTTAQVYIT